MATVDSGFLDATVRTLDGATVTLGELTRGQTTVLVFLRHFG